MAVEADGVPTVAIHTHVFARLARNAARVNGTPTLRQAFVPQPVVGVSAAQLRAYVDGVDPVSKRPFMQELIEGLTGPLTEEDLAGISFERNTPRLLEPATEDNLHRRFEQERWTDYLPIVLPTEERVAAMLKGTSHAPDEVVGRLRPTNYREFWEFTVEKVAVNAVMASVPSSMSLTCSRQCSARRPRPKVVERQPWKMLTTLCSGAWPICTCKGSQGLRSSFSAKVRLL